MAKLEEGAYRETNHNLSGLFQSPIFCILTTILCTPMFFFVFFFFTPSQFHGLVQIMSMAFYSAKQHAHFNTGLLCSWRPLKAVAQLPTFTTSLACILQSRGFHFEHCQWLIYYKLQDPLQKC